MKLEFTLPEVADFIKDIQQNPENIFHAMRLDIRETVGRYLSELMKAELTHFLGREPYQRSEENKNSRNGSYDRHFTLKGIGEVDLKIPRDRNGEFKTKVIPRRQEYEKALVEDLSLMFLNGISTRSLSLLSKRLIGRTISHSEVSKANKELTGAVEQWRLRDLSAERIKYMFVDGVHFKMRVSNSIESVPVLVAVGVAESGHKLVLGMQSGDKESASNWREFFKDLKSRGLKTDSIVLGIMDGLTGLETVFKQEFGKAKIQRCQVHVARNVIAKAPRKLKRDVADGLRSIFYASTRPKAKEHFEAFKKRWERELPSAVKTLESTLEACLTYHSFPPEEWISLRTTNIIERLNKEFKRRTKTMEIVAGEESCYRLLAFICLKMEVHWRSNPVGKVRRNLPFFKELEDY